MSDLEERAAPSARPSVTLDAVCSHLRRRSAYADDEALMLSVTVRDLAAENDVLRADNDALRARIAELEAGEVK